MTDDKLKKWKAYNLYDAYRDRPPTEYIVDWFFATHTLNIVYGAPASMKSMILADLCAHVVAGTNWLPGMKTEAGTNGIPLQKSPILWVDADNGTRRTHERIDAVSKAQNLNIDSPFYYISMPLPPLVASDNESLLMLVDLAMETKARIIVIDNLGLITGNVEENSAGMAQVMGNLRELAEITGAAVIVIHHQRKGGANGSRAGDALRGHSSIEASLDLAIHIAREPNSNLITGRSTKTRGVDVPDFAAEFYYEHKPGTKDLGKAYFTGIAPKRGDNAIRDEIIDVVSAYGEIGKKKLYETVKDNLGQDAPGVNKIRAWIDDMIGVTGELVEYKKGIYRVIKLGNLD